MTFTVPKISTGWANDVEEILALLSILAAKAGKKSPVVPFIKVIDKLIIHSEVRWKIILFSHVICKFDDFFCIVKVAIPLQSELDRNIYPRIIACGTTKKDITHYYVVIENHLVFVS